MSIEVRVPEEIKDYKESIVAGLSIRQLACGAVALGCGIPTFLLLKNINQDLATYATMVVAIPAFCVGFIKKNGYTFEKFVKIKLTAMFGKNKRTYRTEGISPPIEAEEYRAYYQRKIAEKQQAENEKKEEKRFVHTKRKRDAKKAQRKNTREYEIAEISTQSIKRARKTAFKAIKNAERGSREKKQEEKEEAQGRSGT